MREHVVNHVGRDDDDGAGWLIAVVIIITIIIMAIMVVCTIGALIGAFYSLRSYIQSFKENVVDSNRLPNAA